jgi:hypothetical protein
LENSADGEVSLVGENRRSHERAAGFTFLKEILDAINTLVRYVSVVHLSPKYSIFVARIMTQEDKSCASDRHEFALLEPTLRSEMAARK